MSNHKRNHAPMSESSFKRTRQSLQQDTMFDPLNIQLPQLQYTTNPAKNNFQQFKDKLIKYTIVKYHLLRCIIEEDKDPTVENVVGPNDNAEVKEFEEYRVKLTNREESLKAIAFQKPILHLLMWESLSPDSQDAIKTLPEYPANES